MYTPYTQTQNTNTQTQNTNTQTQNTNTQTQNTNTTDKNLRSKKQVVFSDAQAAALAAALLLQSKKKVVKPAQTMRKLVRDNIAIINASLDKGHSIDDICATFKTHLNIELKPNTLRAYLVALKDGGNQSNQ
jgi:hypothetical protein